MASVHDDKKIEAIKKAMNICHRQPKKNEMEFAFVGEGSMGIKAAMIRKK